MKISETLDSIRKRDIVLPEFQREYVWGKEQAKQLMVSLFRAYPVGGLLLWKTDAPPELKNVDKLPEKLGTMLVLLDGQQRMTTLHMLMTGDIPAYYKPEEILNDPRDLYFNVHTTDFQYYQASKMKDDPHWLRVVDCFIDIANIKPVKIAQQKPVDGEDPMDLAQRLMDNLTRLRSIRDIDLPEQIVPMHASLTEAIDIFDRVNSLGTKLTDAELALTHITAKWSVARRLMKAKMGACSDLGFDFGLTFMTRALTTAVTGRALFETIHDRPREALEEGWGRLSKVLDYLMGFLPQKAHIHSTEDLNTSNALVPLVAYLCANNGKFPNEQAAKYAINWLYASLMWGRYTGQTDTRLEADVAVVAKEALPWDNLRGHITDQRGRIQVEASDFAGRGVQHPLYRTTFILAKAHNAVDWFNGLPLAKPVGSSYGLHSHHIFPQALLYNSGYDVGDYTARQLVNEIANRAFLTADSNVSLGDTPPEVYLPKVEEAYPGALASQFIPMDPSLWKVDRYEDFLETRRALIARKLNEFMESLIKEPEPTHHRPVADLIRLGEGYSLEFKSTFQWDVVKGAQNTGLRTSSLKTIAAFLNSDGGTLLIGVEDAGAIVGLDPDLKLLGGSLDKFEQLLVAQVCERIGAEVSPFFRIRFEEVESRKVCVIDVERSPEAVFTKTEKGKEFFVRSGNTTRSLDHEETLKYQQMHWDQ